MKIIRLEAQNVKRIRAVEITPQGNIVEIRGRNAQGKTSVLDSIQYALGGKSATAPQVIRRGESEAHVVLELDGLVVERKWTSNEKSYLEVRDADGNKVTSPQAKLDRLVGALSFDPLAFMRYEPKKQLQLLRELTGVNTDDIDAEHRQVYEERTVVNRELERLRARVPPVVVGLVPDREFDAAEVLAEQQKAQAEIDRQRWVRAGLEQARRDVTAAKTVVEAEAREVARLEQELAAARKRLTEAEASATDASDAVLVAEKAVGALPPAPDMSAFAQRLAELEKTNAAVRAKRERERIIADGKAKKAEADALSKKLEQLTAAKEERIRSAKFPVDGLGFGADGITYQGLPFEQASSAEQLRVSLAMGLALNPELKVLLIRDGSLLDADSMAMVAEMAAKAGAQVWVECVGEGGAGVVIEDGGVVGAAAAPTPKPLTEDTLPF